jgi:hypothetical protein
MLVLAFFSWWYGKGWSGAMHGAGKRINNVNRAFSVPLLLKTMFSPWRRIVSYPGSGLEAHMRALADNLVSRIVGFVVRLLVLIAALLLIGALLVGSLVELLIWPLLPPAIIGCIVLGVIA